MTRRQCDLLIVGAGPAGMAAAAAARAAGLSVIVADEGRAPGGQIYRNVSAAPAPLAQWLGADVVVKKPFRVPDLVSAVEEAVNKQWMKTAAALA